MEVRLRAYGIRTIKTLPSSSVSLEISVSIIKVRQANHVQLNIHGGVPSPC